MTSNQRWHGGDDWIKDPKLEQDIQALFTCVIDKETSKNSYYHMLPVCFGTISCMHHLIHIFQRVTLGISYLIPFSRLFRHQVTPLRPFPSKQSYHRAQKSYLWWHEAKIFTAERTREGGEGPRGACAPQKILTGTFNLVSGHALHAAFWFSSIRSENYLFIAVAIWPVTGQCFQNPKWPAVRYFQYIWLI